MAAEFSKANIEHQRLTRLADRLFPRLGFQNRPNLVSQIHTLAEQGDATTVSNILAEQGILKFRHTDADLSQLAPHQLRNIVTEARWLETLQAFKEAGIQIDGLLTDPADYDFSQRVIHKAATGIIKAEKFLFETGQVVENKLDRVSEFLNPDIQRLRTVYEQGAKTAEDLEILSRAGGDQSGYSTLSLMLSFSLGVVAALTVGALGITLAPVGFMAGFVGSFALTSPQFRESAKNIFMGALPLVAFLGARVWARHHFDDNWFAQMLVSYSAFAATYVLRGSYNSLKDRVRIGRLLKQQAQAFWKRDVLFRITETLYEVREERTSSSIRRAISGLDGLAYKVDREIDKMRISDADRQNLRDELNQALQDSQDVLNRLPEDTQTWDALLDEALLPVQQKLERSITALYEPHKPNQRLIALSRIARALGLAYLIPLTYCFLTKMQGPWESIIFSGIYLSQLYYTFGGTYFMGTVETQEQVEMPKYPKLPEDKKLRPGLTMTRYAFRGIRGDKAWDCMTQDLLSKVHQGPLHVIIDNAEANLNWYQTYGMTRMSHRYEGRMAVIQGLIDNRGILNHLPAAEAEKVRGLLAWNLSIKERKVPPHRILDDVCYELFNNSPNEGQVVRFRDSIGGWTGERVTLDTLIRLFNDELHQIQDSTRRRKYRRLAKKLNSIFANPVFRKHDFNLDVLFNREALRLAFMRMDKDQFELDELLDLIENNRERHLCREMRRYAFAAGIDPARAYVISRRVVDGIRSKTNADPIAQLGNECLIYGSTLPQAKKDRLAELLAHEFPINPTDAANLVEALVRTNVDEQAKNLVQEYDFGNLTPLYYRMREQIEFSRALEQKAASTSEEANLAKTFQWIMSQEDSALSEGQREFKKFVLQCAAANKAADPVAWFNKNLEESSLSLTLALRIEYEAMVHKYLEGKHFENAKELSEEIGVAVAHNQLFGRDWISRVTAKMNSGLNREAAEHEVWKEWLEILEPNIKGLVQRKLPQAEAAEAEAVWKILEQELNRHKLTEIDLTTHGALQLIAHEVEGLRSIAAALGQALNDPNSKERRLIDQAAQLKANLAQAHADFEALLGGNPDLASAMHGDLKKLIGAGIGTWFTTHGWIKSFDQLAEEIPEVVLGIKDLDQEHKGEIYLVAKRLDKYRKETRGVDQQLLIDQLRSLVEAECALRDLELSLRERVAIFEEAHPLPGQREKLIERGLQKPLAEELIRLAAAGMTGPQLHSALEKKIVDIILASFNTEGPKLLLHPGNQTKPIIEEIYQGIVAGNIKRRYAPLPADFTLTHCYNRLSMHMDHTRSKGQHSNLNMLNSRAGEQMGTFLRYCITRLAEEREGFFRIPVKVHNVVKEDVVRLIRLQMDETKDFYAKVERGITPDDIARQLVYLIWNGNNGSGMSYRQAAREVWENINPSREEIKTTEDYCRGKTGDIYTNLVDIAFEIAILTCAHEALGVTAAYYEIKQGRSPDPNHEYMQALERSGGANQSLSSLLSHLLSGRHLNAEQFAAVRSMAEDLSRKLKKDEELRARIDQLRTAGDERAAREVEEEILYKGPWYTIPALWTPRDGTNELKQALPGMEKMRNELIIPRARTLEEIVAWACSQQERLEWFIEEGRTIEQGGMLRRIAQAADQIIPATNNQTPKLIAQQTPAAKEELKRMRRELTQTIRTELQSREDQDESIINYLDTGRFEPTYFERVDAEFQGNWDTDNVPSYRFPQLLTHFGYYNGLLVYRGDGMIQAGHDNYEYQGLGNLIRSQYDKDQTLSRNMMVARSQKAPFGVVRSRSRRFSRTAFPVGYANALSLDCAMECTYNISAVNWSNQTLASHDAVFLNQIRALKLLPFWHVLKRGTRAIPFLAAFYGLAYFTLGSLTGNSDGFPGFTELLPALGVIGGGYLFSKALKTPATSTIFATYLLTTLLSGGNWHAGSELWSVAGWSGLINAGLFHLLPRMTNYMSGAKRNLNEYYRGPAIYNILSIVEDSATGVAILRKDFQVVSNKGAYQWNDAVTNLAVLFGQYDRWFGGNAEYLKDFFAGIYKYRQVLTTRQWLDLLVCYAYPLSSFAVDLNRLGLVGLTAAWMAPLLMLNPEIPKNNFLQPHLFWICELGFLSFITSVMAFRQSRAHEGAQSKFWNKKGWGQIWPHGYVEIAKGLMSLNADRIYYGAGSVSRHFWLEILVSPVVRKGVMEKLISDLRIGFVATQNYPVPMKINLRGRDIPAAFMRKNWAWMAIFAYLGYKVIRNNIMGDAVGRKDYSSYTMTFVAFWLGFEYLRLQLGRLFLNQGVTPIEKHKKWEKKNKKKLKDLIEGRRDAL